jgi:hypothetical protein
VHALDLLLELGISAPNLREVSSNGVNDAALLSYDVS